MQVVLVDSEVRTTNLDGAGRSWIKYPSGVIFRLPQQMQMIYTLPCVEA